MTGIAGDVVELHCDEHDLVLDKQRICSACVEREIRRAGNAAGGSLDA